MKIFNDKAILNKCKKLSKNKDLINKVKEKVGPSGLSLVALYHYYLERQSKTSTKEFNDFLNWFLETCAI